ncbi:putative uncharacterized protein [Tetragenococcus halophilus subsp. halophilus]|uniref:Type II toxin-antitoxin system HicA family toxin n=2 Tax=Tetragenococcus halophilus TaxID=51669 RepID=A0AAN1SHR6_TETHN|nr:hypothetical protein TEH_19230 [Tetragenococcus halophilus NBRC 12172]GBD62446.1 putative uncharacterized protein [Tetragenococcus halophilus subsp. halophilus]GBD66751.1 putative uncharacterized protein [Tetragenococcus halophilus subsp. halophilus]GBD71828.1 putative uncharacterized protein [Tetragenococcus halophilus subsp. halophilus]GBD77163.1 putative uncharacterized protein [Tetragenococcus halophilus subsp. halophilus]
MFLLMVRAKRVNLWLSGSIAYMPMTQKQMVKYLAKNGWTIVPKQGKGLHVKMCKSNSRPIIIFHGELNKYTERGILKQAGLY